jgi:hypothetical protein
MTRPMDSDRHRSIVAWRAVLAVVAVLPALVVISATTTTASLGTPGYLNGVIPRAALAVTSRDPQSIRPSASLTTLRHMWSTARQLMP